MKSLPPTADQIALMNDLKAALGRHTSLDGQQMLAVTAQLVGNLVAFQDQRRFTPELVMEMVAANIEQGNLMAVHGLVGNVQGRA